MKELVSIITPVYNGELFIAMAIESVLQQTYENWELLVINDGSVDGTKNVVSRYKDSRIKYFEQSNKGVSAARNVGLREMKGKFFTFLDADDWLPPASIEVRVKKFDESNEINFVDGYVAIYSEPTLTTERIWKPRYVGNPLHSLLRLSSECFFGPTWMIRSYTWKTYQFEEGLHYSEDLLFYISIAEKGTYSFVTEQVYCYRNRQGSAMKSIKALGNGYLTLRAIICKRGIFKLWDRVLFEFRFKKSMTLSFLKSGQVFNALIFLCR